MSKTQLHREIVLDTPLGKIRKTVGENPIWVSLDETRDAKGQLVVNTIVGCLSAEEATTPFLLVSGIVEEDNHATTAQAFTNAMNLLWPDGIHFFSYLMRLYEGNRKRSTGDIPEYGSCNLSSTCPPPAE